MGKTIPLETKKQVLKLFRQGLRSRKISETLGLDRSTVKEWQYLYDGGDTRWVTDKPISRVYRFSETQRAFIVKAYVTHALTMADLCRTFTVPKTMIKRWVRTYKKDGAYHCDTGSEEDKRTRKRNQILEDLLQCIRGERDRSSKKKVLTIIERGKDAGLSVSFMLKQINICRSEYYYWKTHPGKDDSDLISRIRRLQEDNKWNLGSKAMSQKLKEDIENPITVNHKKIARIMTENNLHAKQKIKKHPDWYYRNLKEERKHLPKNLVARKFVCVKPGSVLLTDITYVKTHDGWLYFAAVKDLFNKEIVAFSVSKRLDMEFTYSIIEKLKERYGSLSGKILHSDRGWNYTNKNYRNLLKELRVKQSLSRKGNCWDNAPMESFFSTFKSETIHHMKDDGRSMSYEEAKTLVENYVYDYNHYRISRPLRWMSPIQFREKYA